MWEEIQLSKERCSSPERIPGLSGFVINYNEAQATAAALASLSFCDELMVVDKSSKENPITEIDGLADRLILTEWTPIVEETRQRAVNALTGPWIIFLDADEMCTPGLRDWLRLFLSNVRSGEAVAAVQFARANYRFGFFSKRQFDWPNRQTRLIRKGRVRLPKTVHSRPEITGGEIVCAPLEVACSILHFSYPSFADYLEKAGRYTESPQHPPMFLAESREPADGADHFSLFAKIRASLDRAEALARNRATNRFEVLTFAIRAFYDSLLHIKFWIRDLGPESRESEAHYRKLRQEVIDKLKR